MKHDCKKGSFSCYQDREIDPLLLRCFDEEGLMDIFEIAEFCPFCGYQPERSKREDSENQCPVCLSDFSLGDERLKCDHCE